MHCPPFPDYQGDQCLSLHWHRGVGLNSARLPEPGRSATPGFLQSDNTRPKKAQHPVHQIDGGVMPPLWAIRHLLCVLLLVGEELRVGNRLPCLLSAQSPCLTNAQDDYKIVLRYDQSTTYWEVDLQSTVSVRWQTVIPREIRRQLGIEPRSKLEWELKDGFIQVRPIPADPVRASLGLLESRDLSTESLLEERRRERVREGIASHS